MALSCYAGAWAGTVRVYDYKTGALVGTAIGESAGLGDGYVLVSVNDTYKVWNLTTNALDVLPGCHAFSTVATTDGVGHVVCQSPTELIWRDYSSLSTSAGRVLGWIAPSVFPSGTWTPQIDVTKAFSAGTLRISLGATVIRDLPVAGSADGSVRGVSWDGKDASGAVVSGRDVHGHTAGVGARRVRRGHSDRRNQCADVPGVAQHAGRVRGAHAVAPAGHP